ncbi:MAG TPA: PIG-L deacetylase family protein [Actinomycetes bacterium]|jgi:LmbE family N-acetylglucosaminyl deacetylase|nr:PIG-L deacetylase family protein [Actinomycetes bacterium]
MAEPLATTPERVLALAAHTKDADVNAGGLLGRWAASGSRVVLAVVTDSSRGTTRVAQDRIELSLRRAGEQRAAGDILGYAEIHFLGFPDGELDTTERSRRAVANLIRTVRPDVVVTHDPWKAYELIPDHRTTGFLACDAVVAARDSLFFPELEAAGLPPWRPRSLIFFAPEEPNAWADVAAVLDRKLDAVLCHRTHSLRGQLLGELDHQSLGALRAELKAEHHDESLATYVERFHVHTL